MHKKRTYHGFLKKYHNVYLYIGILVGCGIIAGSIMSSYIDVSDTQYLSSFLTTIDSNVSKYDYFVSEIFFRYFVHPFNILFRYKHCWYSTH